jgi:general secretion pathway protein A
MFDDFYGLDGRPFQLTPDPAFYFESNTHRKALSYLGYGLAQGEGFVVITGEVGAGKSTMVAHLMATIDPARLTAAQVVTSRLDGEEIVHVVAQAFGLMIEGHDKAGALGAIEGFLHEEARAGRRCLLIVDESQNLPIEALEELRMLSNFQLGSHPLLQTLLLGQPEFRDTLLDHPALEQLRQRVIATYHLEAMDAKEVQPYIEHRLKCVGWKGNPSFDQRVFAGIFDSTGGIPRRINQIVNRLLLLGSVDERTRIDGAMLQQVLDELGEDGTLSLLRKVPQPKPAPEPEAPVADEPEATEATSQEEETEPDVQEFFPDPGQQPEPELETLEDALETSGTASEIQEFKADTQAEPEAVGEASEECEPETEIESEVQVFIAESGEETGTGSEVESPAFAPPSDVSAKVVEFASNGDEELELSDEAETEGNIGEEAESQPKKCNEIDFTQPFDGPDASEIEETLAEQGAQIAALRQAVYDLADAANSAASERKKGASASAADLAERIEALEGRLLEQDLTIRHTLTMLIEWIESGEGGREAA